MLQRSGGLNRKEADDRWARGFSPLTWGLSHLLGLDHFMGFSHVQSLFGTANHVFGFGPFQWPREQVPGLLVAFHSGSEWLAGRLTEGHLDKLRGHIYGHPCMATGRRDSTSTRPLAGRRENEASLRWPRCFFCGGGGAAERNLRVASKGLKASQRALWV